MKRIASFTVNHDTLTRGMYISRIDGDIITYDLRMKKPNGNDYLENAAMHTIEHLLATFVRNSDFANSVIYAGPMGCRTGFYLLLRDDVTRLQALELVKSAFEFIKDFSGEIPGNTRIECGNYLEHNLSGAREIAAEYLPVLNEWNADKMDYSR